MNRKNVVIFASAAALAAACGQTANGQSEASAPAEDATPSAWGAPSGEYTIDKEHGYITFSYLHQGYSRPYLRWRDWDATLNFDADNPENSSVNVTIVADSIDSGVDRFDGHLKSADFFDTANHPQITFTSTGLEQTGETTGKMTGDLTVKGISKPVTLDVSFNKGDYASRSKAYKLGFSATGKVLRSDFGVDAYAPAVSDEVELIIETEFEMPTEE